MEALVSLIIIILHFICARHFRTFLNIRLIFYNMFVTMKNITNYNFGDTKINSELIFLLN